jgi:hypothetical protein
VSRQRVPPHNVEAEAAVLGAVLISGNGLADEVAAEGLTASAFYKPVHQRLWSAVEALRARGDPIEALTVRDELRRAGLDEDGLDALVVAVEASTPSLARAPVYARMVIETAALRRAITLAADITEAAYERDWPAVLARFDAARERLGPGTPRTTSAEPVDWHALFDADPSVPEWLVEDFWPRGRMISLSAPRKERKSLLMLYLAACLAVGRCPWSHRAVEPVVVAYLDFEMTEDDLLERVEDMGFAADDLADLRYFLHPRLPLLDTPEGGRALLALLDAHQPGALVIDTFGRVISGEDWTGADVRDFYRWSAEHVKARGISVARLDHTGHTDTTRAKGSADKGADVDVGWVIHPGDQGALRLAHHGLTRVRWVPEHLDLVMTDDPLAFRRGLRAWPPGTAEVARELDDLGLPLDVSGNAAQRALRARNQGRNRSLVLAAVAYRREPHP